MFDNDLTKNYQLQDATFEILIMLAGAFLLGTLFCWALGKLRSNKRKHPYQRKTVDHQNGYKQPAQQAGATYPDDVENNLLQGTAGGAAGILGGSLATAESSLSGSANIAGDRLANAGAAITESVSNTPHNASDKLTSTGSAIVDGVTDTIRSVEGKLANAGSTITDDISSTTSNASDKLTNIGSVIVDNVTETANATGDKLANVSSSITDKITATAGVANNTLVSTSASAKERLSETLDASGNTVSNAGSFIKEKTSNTLKSIKDEIPPPQSKAIPAKTTPDPLQATDNLKKIEGIGPKIEVALHTANIRTYADLRASDHDTLKAILIAANPTFQIHDPETWPYQADLAYNEKWEKLKEYQDFLMGRDE
jgi:predicted flap endonuclease-1-like 5' DNA nuclease